MRRRSSRSKSGQEEAADTRVHVEVQGEIDAGMNVGVEVEGVQGKGDEVEEEEQEQEEEGEALLAATSFTCEHCGKVFKSEGISSLISHLTFIHFISFHLKHVIRLSRWISLSHREKGVHRSKIQSSQYRKR